MGIFKDLLNLFYPEVCMACTYPLLKGEDTLCLRCIYELPKTNFHSIENNLLEQRLWERIPVQKASSYYYFFKDGPTQNLLHHIKYRGIKKAAETLGRMYGEELMSGGNFSDVDMIVPVPLHRKKESKRGYNQSEWFAKGLSASLGTPLEAGTLIRTKNTKTQTRKSALERLKNVDEVFFVTSPQRFAGKHILLVDDVVTTGATLEACGKTILNCGGNIKISIATIAFAS